MQQIADLHIHSKYSRGCSPLLDLPNIDRFCRVKGVDIVGTGDFTYPAWFKDIKEQLEEIDSSGLYRLKKELKIEDDGFEIKNHPNPPLLKEGTIVKREAKKESFPLLQREIKGDFVKETKFILSTELALVYKKFNKTRRLHLVVLAPNIQAVEKLNNYLDKKYNLRSDGRPILGMSAEELCEICFGIDDNFMIIPAHAWTPWFAVFGSKSGFNTLEECFGKWAPKINAIETGLSSDPEMNWSLSMLDNITLISNSDAHSLPNLGREANIFDLEKITYKEIKEVIETGDKKKFLKTIEFYPEEGMYHFDGHRGCGVSFDPEETKKRKGICPKCDKPLVVGVANRVQELADRKFGYRPKTAIPFIKLVELDKIIAESLNIKNRISKKVQAEYKKIINSGNSELDVLLNLSKDELKKITGAKIVEGIIKMRKGELTIKPGFDGQYGKIKIFN